MKELQIDDDSTRRFFVTAFGNGNLVPIIGAGFTENSQARNGKTVPSGCQLKEYMIRQIAIMRRELGEHELSGESFSSIAELFEDTYDDIRGQGISQFFNDHFTGVRIRNTYKLEFLNKIDWKYVYTLNIDTGIEDSDRDRWEVFYPNREFDEKTDYGEKKKLYKIHGDAGQFVKSLDYDEMILTESQYIRSLYKNRMFHDMLSADCGNKNMIYIGCSLEDEIDIRYSVLSDTNRNQSEMETYRIYVTADPLTEIKKIKLERYNISHYILLQSVADYDYLYEFLVSCFEESIEGGGSGIENLRYTAPEMLGSDAEENLKYLADISRRQGVLPHYYFERDMISAFSLSKDKVNVIVGRRFSGKTMLAYNIMEHYRHYQRYFIKDCESVSSEAIHELMELKNALIVFDSGSVDGGGFIEILNLFNPSNQNAVCFMINSYDDVYNLVNYKKREIYLLVDRILDGKLSDKDITSLNKRLDEIGISRFDNRYNILDNTLRIANVYKENVISGYTITENDELVIIIWLLVKRKMYFQEIISLGLSRQYKDIVRKFMPFMQEEVCKKSEAREHSEIKVICNGKLGLLQILNSYAYPPDSRMGKVVAIQRQQEICKSIYRILSSFTVGGRMCQDTVKEFMMFDTLNDIFSRKYSQEAIDHLASPGTNGKILSGAAGLIQLIYSDDNIKRLMASDPNYWLQRAKSVYITFKKRDDIAELYKGIKWAIKAEQDSSLKYQRGEKRYYRTMSNAVIQIAMLYGRVAKLNEYRNDEDIGRAIEYYCRGLSDENNVAAATTLINNSKGTGDFKNLVEYITVNWEKIDRKWEKAANFLLNVRIKGNLFGTAQPGD